MVGTRRKQSASQRRENPTGTKAGKWIPFFAAPLMLVGVVCILASFALKSLPDEAVWSEEQAVAHQRASNKFHRDQFDKNLSESELSASREAFEEIDAKLSRAKDTQSYLPVVVRWVGIVCTGLGYIVLLIVRSNEE